MREARRDMRDGRIDPRMDAKRQAVAGGSDVIKQRVELAAFPGMT
jgi:hypothetical protein